MHDGADSEFYLLKGFRVVAVEADSNRCRVVGERLRSFVTSGQLTVLNCAIAPKCGPVTFYRSTISGWSTVVSEIDVDNAKRGASSEQVDVEGIKLSDLARQYGDAFYLKLDIEGMDREALKSLVSTSFRPTYVSMETTFARDPSFDTFRCDLELLAELGYDRFKIIDQTLLQHQLPPKPSLAGTYVPHRFTSESSGLFGEETPGPWLTFEDALTRFRRISRWKWIQVLLYRRMRLYLRYCAVVCRL